MPSNRRTRAFGLSLFVYPGPLPTHGKFRLLRGVTTSVENNSVFRSFFEKQKLTGPNFIDWYKQLGLELSIEDKENYLEHPNPVAPVAPPGQQVPPEAHPMKSSSSCKPEEGQSVSSHVLKMKGYIDNMERLGQPVGQNLAEGFKKTKKNKSHKAGKGSHGKGKGKIGNASNNALFASKPKTPPPPKKDNPTKDAICHQCGEVGHWRRNCPVYLVELIKKKKLSQGASTLGIFTIELYSFPSKSWIYDTGCGTHICITTQGLRGSKKRKPGALSLYVGDGHRTAVEAIGTFHLELPSGLVIVLNNCHYAPSITRGVISVSRLFDNGFVNCFDDNSVILVFKNNLVYFKVVPRDGIYEIDMSYSNTNDSSMYAITNKRAKIDLDSSLLWHCRLGHISKKRIEKLPHDGLLNSIDIESLENPSENKVFVARNAEFFESKLLDLKASGSVKDLELIQEEDANPSVDTSLNHKEDDQEIDEPQSDINPIRKSSRTCRAPDRMCLYIDAEEHELGDLGEPANYKAAFVDPESKKWLDAMNVEMQSMKDNDVWVLVELPPNARTVRSKWLYKKKTVMDGAVYIFKAGLVAKGFTQTYGVDYEETFSPVADIRAIRIFIAIVAYYDYEI
nr:hypothetical protein [Tanacetum cinerariifolium]